MLLDRTAAVGRFARLAAYWELTKPGIAGFAMVTAGVSYYVAAAGRAEILPVVHTLLGTVLATAGALALNQYMERGVDSLMVRTRVRPLPSKRLVPAEAFVFGMVLVLAGVGHLAFHVGWLPAALTALAAVSYTLVYTPLKTRSYTATFAGAIPGSMPALIGWSAATGEVALGALVIFGIVFIWQLPHVISLGWLLREDYERAGFLLIPPSDPKGKRLGRQMVFYAAALLPMSLFPTGLRLTGMIYLGGALVLGVMMLWACLRAHREMTRERARRVFLASLVYHPVLLAFMLVDTVRV
jgi:heme o synthase